MRSINCASMIDLTEVKINYDVNLEEPNAVLCDSTIHANVEIVSNFPGSISCSEVYVTVIPTQNVNENSKQPKTLGKRSTPDKLGSSTMSEKMGTLSTGKSSSSSSEVIPIKQQLHLKQDGSLSSVALVCPSAHQLLG